MRLRQLVLDVSRGWISVTRFWTAVGATLRWMGEIETGVHPPTALLMAEESAPSGT
jgi:hypothetical protein